MYLKEISLENFKSFGRKVKIPLQPGYTVITGPNGSGKSNISDGILFVLGPKSSKMIRAGKLTDLIYNGGKDKNPSTYATVSLTFDNSDRAIPYDADDVVLTRTVRKSTMFSPSMTISPSEKGVVDTGTIHCARIRLMRL
jgi:chromosome segregation protein